MAATAKGDVLYIIRVWGRKEQGADGRQSTFPIYLFVSQQPSSQNPPPQDHAWISLVRTASHDNPMCKGAWENEYLTKGIEIPPLY
jgi:hypothetical protein